MGYCFLSNNSNQITLEDLGIPSPEVEDGVLCYNKTNGFYWISVHDLDPTATTIERGFTVISSSTYSSQTPKITYGNQITFDPPITRGTITCNGGTKEIKIGETVTLNNFYYYQQVTAPGTSQYPNLFYQYTHKFNIKITFTSSTQWDLSLELISSHQQDNKGIGKASNNPSEYTIIINTFI